MQCVSVDRPPQQDSNRETILTDIQGIRQKISEAGHVQRQYRTIADVLNRERIGYEKQLLDLEKSIAQSEAEALRLKVGAAINQRPFIFFFFSIPKTHSLIRRPDD